MERMRIHFPLKVGIIVILFLGIIALFYSSPLPIGDDWRTFYDAGMRVLHSRNLYTTPTSFAWYSNPPWLAILLCPLAVMGPRLGWSVLSAVSVLSVVGVVQRFGLGKYHILLLSLSPPFIYTMLHGQVDAALSLGLLLPAEWWAIVALTKPQTFGGLLFWALREHFLKTFLLLVGIVTISIIIFGNWPMDLLRQPKPFVSGAHNIWLGLWPFQLVGATFLLQRGIKFRNSRYFLAASPLLLPYATVGNLYGAWLVLCMVLSKQESTAILLVWWGTVLWRAVM